MNTRGLLIVLLLPCFGCDDARKVELPKPSRPGSDWPTFLGPQQDGSSPETGILTEWPRDGLKKLWEARLGSGYAPPVVADGQLFHFDRFDDDAVLTCRHAETGKLIWKYSYPTVYEDFYGYDNGPRACPVIDTEHVFLHGVDGQLCCVTRDTGKEVWRIDTKAKYRFHQNFFGVGSVPVLYENLLIVPIGGSEPRPRPVDLRQAQGNGTGLVAFDKATGTEVYRTTDGLASYASPTVNTLHGQPTLLYFARGGLVAINPTDGKERFSFPWRAKSEESANAANHVVIGDTILLSECYEKGTVLLKISKDFTPEIVWSDLENDRREKTLLAHWCTPIVQDGYAYGSSGRHESEGDLRCFDLKTGEVQWVVPRMRRCTLTKIDGHMLCLAEDGTLSLYKLNPKKAERVAVWEERFNEDLLSPCWAPPVVARGLLYLRGRGKLVCYELIPAK